MRADLGAFVRETGERAGAPLPPLPKGYFLKALSAADRIDAATLGAAELAEILAGPVSERDIDPRVVAAFHLQYPHAGDLVPFLRDHPSPEEIKGIVAAVKGKLFEIEYLDVLNHRLPEGFHATLAGSPTQPGWDIMIQGPNGETADLLRAKCTASLHLIREALERHPGIDVVTTREAFSQCHDPHLADHLIESGLSNTVLEEKTAQAAELATQHDPLGYHFPFLAVSVILGQIAFNVARGRLSPAEAFRQTTTRILRTATSSGLGHLVTVWTTTPWAGLGAGIAFRLLLGKIDHAHRFAQASAERRGRIRTVDRGLGEGSANRAGSP